MYLQTEAGGGASVNRPSGSPHMTCVADILVTGTLLLFFFPAEATPGLGPESLSTVCRAHGT